MESSDLAILEPSEVCAPEGQWLSVQEFCVAAGVVEKTVFSRIKKGQYPSRMTDDGRREVYWTGPPLGKVDRENLQKCAERMLSLLEGELRQRHEASASQAQALMELVRENERLKLMAERAERLDEKVSLLEKENSALHRRFQDVDAENRKLAEQIVAYRHAADAWRKLPLIQRVLG